MPSHKKITPRSQSRVVNPETRSSTVTKPARHRGKTAGGDGGARKLYDVEDGSVYEIVAQASEKVPVGQYANVTVGPVAITRRIVIKSVNDDDIADACEHALKVTQEVCESVVAEDREIVLDSVRQKNEREKAERGK